MSGSVSMVDGHIDPDTGITIPEMTPQEALELLNNVEFAEQYQGKDEYGTMLLMCKDALLKQIPKKPKTEFERIKAMSIDEMAEYFLTKSFDPCDITNFPVVDCDAGCDKCIRKWLESEVKAE